MSEQAELAEARAEIRRLREALAFYADPVIYEDWHDTGRRERRVEQAAQAAWDPVDGEFAGIEYRDVEVTAQVWLTTAQEDAGQRARAALGVGEEATDERAD